MWAAGGSADARALQQSRTWGPGLALGPSTQLLEKSGREARGAAAGETSCNRLAGARPPPPPCLRLPGPWSTTQIHREKTRAPRGPARCLRLPASGAV